MTILWPIALITFKEGIRNRAVYGISLFALSLLVANVFISSMIMQDVGKVAVDMALSTVSFSGLLLILFVGINLLAKDLDKRTIYVVLSRPVSRQQYIVGKFLGMVMLILLTLCILSSFALLSILMVKMSAYGYFERFSWLSVLVAIGFIALSLILITAISFFFSSFASTSFITLVMTIITYLIGQSISNVKTLVEAPVASGIEVSMFTITLVKTAYYIFPNLALFNIKTQAAHGLPISSSYVFWTVVYGMVYTSLVIFLSALAFRKREFP